MKNNQKGFSLVELLLMLIIVGMVGFTGWYVWNSSNKANDSLDSVGIAQDSQTIKPNSQSATPSESAQKGTITGKTSYPSDGLPSDLKVCAEASSDKSKVYCVNVGEKQLKEFNLNVPVGRYYVYSQVESDSSGYRAYWNEFAKCGNDASCPKAGHDQLIEVSVTANKTTSDIDPSDWYKL